MLFDPVGQLEVPVAVPHVTGLLELGALVLRLPAHRGELGLHGHWVKLMLHYLFIYKAKARLGWQLIPE